MKFTIFALLGALTSTGANQLRTSVRKLDGARAELDGTANISFAKCVEVTVQPDGDDDDGDMQSAVLAGTARPVKSYAAFYTDDSASDSEMMMVSLGDYVAAKVSASAMKAQKLCETCRQFEETCNPAEEEEEEEAEEQAEEEAEEEGDEADEADNEEEGDDNGDDEGRKLATAIDSNFCYECQAQGCYAEEEEDNGEINYEEQLVEFIEQAAGCMQVENYQDANGNPAYIGMACGSYGDAAEFAVFLDEDCTLETNQVSAASVLASAGANDDGVSLSEIHTFASMYLQEAFTTDLSCEEVKYYDPNADEEDNENEDNQDGYEMNEVCGQITDEAVYISDCVAQDAEGEEEAAYADEEEEETWYDFDVQDGGDIDEVCAVVNEKMNSGGKFDYFYDEKKQGTSYERGVTGSLKSSKSGMHGGLIFFIVALVLLFSCFVCTRRSTKVKNQNAYLGESFSLGDDASVGGRSKSGKSSSYKYKQYFQLYMRRVKSKFSRAR